MVGGRADAGKGLAAGGFMEAPQGNSATLETQNGQKRLELHAKGQGVVVQERKGPERETVILQRCRN